MSKRSYSRNTLPPRQKGIHATLPTLLIVVKTRPERLGVPMPERLRPPRECIAPIRETRRERASPRLYAAALCSARVTDGRIGAGQDHRACERAIAALRARPLRDRCFDIAEILPGVENAHAANDDAVAPSAVQVHAGYRRDAGAAFAQSFFSSRPLTKTTVATCGTTVVVRDSTVTMWA
ncbi:hypothetical protein LGN17_08125 [Burkholderia sp. AU30280]|uniref:darcynin family protein n=1 Tax=Burkholderia sp. AU30280 TaxID=2879628 RepID=UPI001CF4C3A6|nr:darcynin family protein [Burkholderia sp. AU30280]MCA8272478.1 hypothetical protein [Burkholderia sp. AU30280]